MRYIAITLKVVPVMDYNSDALAVELADRIRDAVLDHHGVSSAGVQLAVRDDDEDAPSA
jgi:hypothetical protein